MTLLKKITAAILCLGLIAGGAAFSACDGDGDSAGSGSASGGLIEGGSTSGDSTDNGSTDGDTTDGDSTGNDSTDSDLTDGDSTDSDTTDSDDVIQDEETWNTAFEELAYTNFSLYTYGTDTYGKESVGIVLYSENVAYMKTQTEDEYLDEIYTVKNSDGTYTTYRKQYQKPEDYDENPERYNYFTIDDAKFWFYEGSSPDWAFNYIKSLAYLEVSYEDYFELFEYDADTQTFSYADEIQAKNPYVDINNGIDDTFVLYCTDNVVKASNNKITYVKCYVDKVVCICNCTRQPDHSGEQTPHAVIEYYDIGTTVVEIPQEVIDEAVYNKWNY